MVYIEPAPYILGFIDAVRDLNRYRINTLFLTRAATQDWGADSRIVPEQILPEGNWAALRALRRRLASRKDALLHLAGWGHPVLLGVLFWAKFYGVPVTVESDTPPPRVTVFWKRFVKRALYPFLFRIPAMFLPGGTRQKEYLRSYDVADEKIRVAQMTVDVERIFRFANGFTPERRMTGLKKYNIEPDSVRFLYLGRLEPHKGLSDLLQAFQDLSQSEDNVALLIAGAGSMANEVREAAERNTKLYYLGRVEGDALWEAYLLADIFVLPSRFEPWGLVVNEAMAASLPTIVSNRAGCLPDLIEDGVTGISVPAEDPKTLAHAMGQLAADKEMRQGMGANGRKRISGWTLSNQATITCLAWDAALN